VGTWTEDTSALASGPNGVRIVSSPTKSGSTRALWAGRGTAANIDLYAHSLPGAVVDGNTVEVKWSVNQENWQSLNNGMQVVIGQEGSNYSNDIAWVLDVSQPSGVNGKYAYWQGPAQYQVQVPATADMVVPNLFQPTLNTEGANEGRWDDFRAVFSFDQVDANTMGGTYSIYVNLNGAGEQTLALDVPVFQTNYNIVDPTQLVVRFNKGPSSGLTFYDNVSINSVVVPEPTALGLGVAAFGLLIRRNRK